MPFKATAMITLDLTQRMKYTALSTIVGMTDEGKGCFGTDFFTFTAGNPLPPIFPTLTPSAAPTISPFPTPDPETAPCNLAAEITCRTGSGGSCDLRSPSGTTCIGSNADQLRFIYVPTGSCDGSNTQDKFKCSDENTGVPRPSTAYIRISRKDTIFYMNAVSAGQVFTFGIPDENDIDIEIFTVVNDGPGTLLQESKMSVRCREEDGLTLLDTFGSLQLVGFRNTEQGSQQIFANVVLSYTTTNESRLRGDLIKATRNSAINGLFDFVGAPITLEAGASQFFGESFDLNLAERAGQTLDFSFLIDGVGTVSNVACGDQTIFSLTIL
jgi:hypothetical protein